MQPLAIFKSSSILALRADGLLLSTSYRLSRGPDLMPGYLSRSMASKYETWSEPTQLELIPAEA